MSEPLFPNQSKGENFVVESFNQASQKIDEFSQAPWLAVDIEFYRRNSYYPEFCLLQVASPEDSLIIDVLAESMTKSRIVDLLKKLILSPLLIFFSGRQDWEIMHQFCGVYPKNLLDLQFAGEFVGLSKQPSLSVFSEKVVSQVKNQNVQSSDWRQRPLSHSQICYARQDVELLALCYQTVSKLLTKVQMESIFQKTQGSLIQAQNSLSVEGLGTKIPGYHRLCAHKQAVLKVLAMWREKKAQKMNLPVQWLCTNRDLFVMSRLSDQMESEIMSAIKPRKSSRFISDLINEARKTYLSVSQIQTQKTGHSG